MACARIARVRALHSRPIGRRIRRNWTGEALEIRALLSADWQNPLVAADVDGSDGLQAVTPLDALLVINELHERSVSDPITGQLPDLGPEEGSPPPFLDVNGDNIVSPLDAALVINQLSSVDWSGAGTQTYHAPDSVMAGTRAAADLSVTDDTLVNFDVGPAQRDADSAANAEGHLWTVWSSLGQDGSSWGVYLQRFDSDGAKAGGEVQVNSTTRHSQSAPAIAMNAEGVTLIVWQSLAQDGSGWGVFGQYFGADGARRGSEFQVNETATGTQWHPDVAALDDGSFVVTWEGRGLGDRSGIQLRRFGESGLPITTEMPANATTSGDQSRPSVTAVSPDSEESDADFAIAWDGRGPGDSTGTFLRIFAFSSPVTAEIAIHQISRGTQRHVMLAHDNTGQIAAAWQSSPDDRGGTSVKFRRFNADGDALSDEATANQTLDGPQKAPSIATLSDGSFVIAWYGRGSGDRLGIFSRMFSRDGAATSDEALVNSTTEGIQSRPALTSVVHDFALAWQGRGSADSFGIYARLLDGPEAMNTSPVLISAVPDQDATQGSLFTLDASTFFGDADPGDILAFSALLAGGGPLPAWLQLNATTGVLSGTPAAGDVGQTDITITATDESNASVSDTFRLTVAALNTPPQLVNPVPDQTAPHGVAFTLNVATFFSDTDALSYTAMNLPEWLTLDPSSGNFTGTPDADEVGPVTVTVTATDTASQSVSDEFIISVTNASPEVSTEIPDQIAMVGSSFRLDVATSFTDPNPGDVLSFSARQLSGGALPGWLQFDAATGIFSGTPSSSDVGALEITVRAADSLNASTDDTFLLTVQMAANRGPAIEDQSFRVAAGVTDGQEIGTILASDPNGDALTYSIVSGNDAGAFAIDPSSGLLTVVDADALQGIANVAMTVQVEETASENLTATAVVSVFLTDEPLLVAFRLQILGTDGQPVDRLGVGDEFDLVYLVQDISGNDDGLFSAYADIGYSSEFVRVTGAVVHSSTYGAGTSGDTAAPGLIDEAGGTDGVSPLGGDEREVLRVRMQVIRDGGPAFFFTDIADNGILHPTLLFDTTDNVPASQIEFGRATLEIGEPINRTVSTFVAAASSSLALRARLPRWSPAYSAAVERAMVEWTPSAVSTGPVGTHSLGPARSTQTGSLQVRPAAGIDGWDQVWESLE